MTLPITRARAASVGAGRVHGSQPDITRTTRTDIIARAAIAGGGVTPRRDLSSLHMRAVPAADTATIASTLPPPPPRAGVAPAAAPTVPAAERMMVRVKIPVGKNVVEFDHKASEALSKALKVLANKIETGSAGEQAQQIDWVAGAYHNGSEWKEILDTCKSELDTVKDKAKDELNLGGTHETPQYSPREWVAATRKVGGTTEDRLFAAVRHQHYHEMVRQVLSRENLSTANADKAKPILASLKAYHQGRYYTERAAAGQERERVTGNAKIVRELEKSFLDWFSTRDEAHEHHLARGMTHFAGDTFHEQLTASHALGVPLDRSTDWEALWAECDRCCGATDPANALMSNQKFQAVMKELSVELQAEIANAVIEVHALAGGLATTASKVDRLVKSKLPAVTTASPGVAVAAMGAAQPRAVSVPAPPASPGPQVPPPDVRTLPPATFVAPEVDPQGFGAHLRPGTSVQPDTARLEVGTPIAGEAMAIPAPAPATPPRTATPVIPSAVPKHRRIQRVPVKSFDEHIARLQALEVQRKKQHEAKMIEIAARRKDFGTRMAGHSAQIQAALAARRTAEVEAQASRKLARKALRELRARQEASLPYSMHD